MRISSYYGEIAYSSNSTTNFVTELKAKNNNGTKTETFEDTSGDLKTANDIEDLGKTINKMNKNILELKSKQMPYINNTYRKNTELLNKFGNAYTLSISDEGYAALNNKQESE